MKKRLSKLRISIFLIFSCLAAFWLGQLLEPAWVLVNTSYYHHIPKTDYYNYISGVFICDVNSVDESSKVMYTDEAIFDGDEIVKVTFKKKCIYRLKWNGVAEPTPTPGLRPEFLNYPDECN